MIIEMLIYDIHEIYIPRRFVLTCTVLVYTHSQQAEFLIVSLLSGNHAMTSELKQQHMK